MAMTPEQRADYERGARERVAKMDPELRARLQPAVDWAAAEIKKSDQQNR